MINTPTANRVFNGNRWVNESIAQFKELVPEKLRSHIISNLEGINSHPNSPQRDEAFIHLMNWITTNFPDVHTGVVQAIISVYAPTMLTVYITTFGPPVRMATEHPQDYSAKNLERMRK